MPRPLALGNGRLLVQFDSRGRIRDLFWPEVGIRNHVGGHYFHTGILEAGKFSWLEGDEWHVEQSFDPELNEGTTLYKSKEWDLDVSCRDQIEGDSLIRSFTFLNRTDWPREIEVFFSQDFRIAESEIGDTAFFHPALDAMVHFKWNYCFVCRATGTEGGLVQKTAGIRGVHGLQGTWRDAEDGRLHDKPIEQGAVDSTFSVRVICPPQDRASAEYRIDCLEAVPIRGEHGPTRPEANVQPHLPAMSGLSEPLIRLAHQSVRILLSQIAANGAILAANDSDIMQSNRANYSYVWPRDGALVAVVLNRLGLHEHARRYHRFILPLITPEQPFFLQKYSADGTLGATWHPWIFEGKPEVPLQEDETALSLWSLAHHVEACGDGDLLDEFYESAVLPMARFLCAHIDPETGLPEPSYDLWEERRGVHTFTVATVVAGLEAAARLAALRGDSEGVRFRETSQLVKRSMLEHLYNADEQRFFRSIGDSAPDASLLLVRRFASLSLSDERVIETQAAILRALWVESPVGGIARYPGDYYARVVEGLPGNPWLITTMWLAQEEIAGAASRGDLGTARELIEWALHRAAPTGVFGEQFHPHTGETMTVSPLTWSHAEYLATILDWSEKYRSFSTAD